MFCESFVDELLRKMKPKKRYDLDNLVGMDKRLESAMKLLDIGAGGFRYFLIHGMGGIGKTTLAKAILDEVSASFDGCSFLKDLGESVTGDRLYSLKKQLMEDLGVNPADTTQSIRGKKVLIILDDVVTHELVKELLEKSWFASGSRIIITTRNVDVMKGCDLAKECPVQSFEMSMLQDDEALQLFKLHAVGKDSRSAIFEDLSKKAILTTGGLPLAIEVIAKLLFGESEEVWRDVIARSKEIPPKEVKDRLKISYDALQDDQKHIFLDIACFFIGKEISNATYMWRACKLYPYYGLGVLRSMSLVKITDENVIWMHDQLRDLGRDIVRQENIRDPMKRSRIWVPEDSVIVLGGKEGKEKVEGLSLRIPVSMTLTREHCESFREMRFLELAGAELEGNFNGLLQNLRWLSWHWCPSDFKISHWYLNKLVILDLSHSMIDENWGGWSLIQMANSLKVLDLRSCHKLRCTPEFSTNHSLERLILSHCSQLAEIGSSIGNLRRLKLLDLRYCYYLRGLPEEIGSLEELEEILVSGLRLKPFSLPNSIGNLTSLLCLELKSLQCSSIPDSIGKLVKLKHLSASGCVGMKELPESLGDLKSLVELDLLQWFTGERLPQSIGGLLELKTLTAAKCLRMKEVPDTLHNLKSLVRLDLSETPISNLPNSIGDLQELQELRLSRCEITLLPESIGRLKKLVELDASSCKLLGAVPSAVGRLSGLRRLKLAASGIRSLPSTIVQLSLLEELYVEECRQLQQVPELPPGLTALGISSSSMQNINDWIITGFISRMDRRSFDELCPNNLDTVQKLANLKKLRLEFLLPESGRLLCLNSMTQLESLCLIFLPRLSLGSLRLLDRDIEIVNLPPLSNLKNLTAIEFHNFVMDDRYFGLPEGGLEYIGVKELENLESIQLSNSSITVIEVCLPTRLRSLSIKNCISLPDLSHLKALRYLTIQRCSEITHIPGLEELELLNSLSIISCSSLERLGDLSKLNKLAYLTLDDCPCLTSIDGIGSVVLEHLSIQECPYIEGLDALIRRCKRGDYAEEHFENYSFL